MDVSLIEGTGGSGDQLIDLENVTGTKQYDQIVGDHQPNHLNGFGGGDMIYGLNGDDWLVPGAAAGIETYLVPGHGNDYVEGGPSFDFVSYIDGPGSVVDLGGRRPGRERPGRRAHGHRHGDVVDGRHRRDGRPGRRPGDRVGNRHHPRRRERHRKPAATTP